jgi:hypothetical protein
VTTPTRTGTSSTTETAATEAKEVAGTAVDATAEVAGTAKEQAGQVLGEGLDQAKNLAGQATATLQDTLRAQSEKVSEQLTTISQQLTNGDTSGVVGQVMTEAGQRLRGLADHLQSAGPEGVLSDLRAYARRNPGSFLLGAAAAGLVTGRLVKGLNAGKTAEPSPPQPTMAQPPIGTSSLTADPYPDPVTPQTAVLGRI